ncbi:copper-containing nitrite reductase [Candidatus Thioglobus sp.]|jgi:nitrite reductase (NO-forming)|uniref:copper-containing nitrite reductase n=1 Tax=Candidatus Thioglobus sp. TaxID=2026721 RepID=UPI001DA506BA|nr:copper-containing nitrite reductase [Candidatus Thioglobus sp.]MBT3276495.1 nitrite reductase, copper-containing [Candidatus Thioglobus sp.]MBT4747659.1 nitrite reductase, copper-containing [Candidatus Thioglobus sp.]MBT6278508.1 nitrite reductase, copper-containing [Candidatus Thioglobus sp.]MBT6359362.1 nitrite reductase, copper-containing [Candidatus Thioglobus sp.]MBT6752055.1 nitrite reductase, copper-containing [Candidatus Thioglobus sp.]
MINIIKNKLLQAFAVAALVGSGSALAGQAAESEGGGLKGFNIGVSAKIDSLPRVTQKLVAPPFLPKHNQVAVGGPKIVEVELIVVEKEMEIAPGVFYQALTFNGSNPGPMIVVHEGDYIELTLKNPKTNEMVHNIDFHASTGALGAGALTHVAPGQTVVLRFKADRTGTFVYHCAPGGTMIPYHVVSGMNGAIMVLPRDGLKDEKGNVVTYDKGYYIGEQDWYVAKDDNGKYKRYDSPIFAMGDTMKVMRGLIPTHLTFNGKVGALTGDNAMKANVGDTVLFIHSQANRDSRVHLIGGHADLFWHGGSFDDVPMTNRETWPVFAGEAAAMTYTFRQPGLYAYVNHNLIEAISLGAAAHVSVEGEWNNDLMEQIQAPH